MDELVKLEFYFRAQDIFIAVVFEGAMNMWCQLKFFHRYWELRCCSSLTTAKVNEPIQIGAKTPLRARTSLFLRLSSLSAYIYIIGYYNPLIRITA